MAASSADAAVSNGHDVSSYDVGMCQKFVRDQCWRVPSLYGSAIEAWNGAREKHPGDRTPPVGAPLYYRGGQYGHAVIACHGGMRSTDCQSTGRVSDIDVGWPERAWGYTYLGWTGDINGVDLPLGGSAPPTGGGEEMPEYLHTSMSSRKFKADTWTFLEWSDIISDTTGKAAVKGEAGLRLSDRRYSATVLANVAAVSGDRIATRFSESKPDGSGGYELAETNPMVEHKLTDGETRIQDTRAGWVGKDRRLRVELMVPNDTTVSADLVVLFW
jgi:hypothetical protein